MPGDGDDKKKAKPCKICSGFGEMFEKTKGGSGGGDAAAPGAAAGPDTRTMAELFGCPENKASLGRAGWSVLHSMAATYPDQPSQTQQSEMVEFITLFSKFYPCGECSKHMGKHIAKSPPKTGSRAQLARWMCETHNEVNVMLKKPVFDCNLVDQRWYDGWDDGSCAPPKGAAAGLPPQGGGAGAGAGGAASAK